MKEERKPLPTTLARSVVLVLIASLMSITLLSGCSSGDDEGSEGTMSNGSTPQQSLHDSDEKVKTVTVSVEIDGSAAEGKVEDEITVFTMGPENIVLQDEDGATAYDALIATGANVEGEPSYVTSIEDLAAGDAGPTSGWMFSVNGEQPSVAADECQLSNGDKVRWYYVDSFE